MTARWDAMWDYLRKLYEQAGREYTLWAADWYEKNEIWALAGITEKVRRAIDKKERRA